MKDKKLVKTNITHSLVAESATLKLYRPKDEKGLIPLNRTAEEPARFTCRTCKKVVAFLVLQAKDTHKTEKIRETFQKWTSCPPCYDAYKANLTGKHLPSDIQALLKKGGA